jgi:nitrile hydratase
MRLLHNFPIGVFDVTKPVEGRRKFMTKAAATTAAALVGQPRLEGAAQEEHEHQTVPSDLALRVKALETVLVEKQMVDPAELDEVVDTYENEIGPRNGAKVVAKAWVDPAFRRRLVENATEAIAELGFGGAEGEHMVVVENEPKVHNLVVCTLCSCYPWPTLGLPPVWYKSAPYRSRAVIDPRGVLREFGLELEDEVEVRVWDSTAETRYLVLPERPSGTENWSESELAEIVTRDSMIGVAKVTPPVVRRGDA